MDGQRPPADQPLVGFYKPERSADNGGTQLGSRDTGAYMQLIVGTFF